MDNVTYCKKCGSDFDGLCALHPDECFTMWEQPGTLVPVTDVDDVASVFDGMDEDERVEWYAGETERRMGDY